MNASPDLLPDISAVLVCLAKLGVGARKDSKHKRGKTGKHRASAQWRREKRKRKKAQADRRFNRKKYS